MLPAAISLATQAPIHEHLIKQLAGTIHAIRYKRAEVFRARNPHRVNTLHPDHVICVSGQRGKNANGFCNQLRYYTT